MTFDEILAQVLDLLQREKRLSYRALKVRFGLDDEHLAALKDEIIEAKQLAVDDRGVVLVWTRRWRASPTSHCIDASAGVIRHHAGIPGREDPYHQGHSRW